MQAPGRSKPVPVRGGLVDPGGSFFCGCPFEVILGQEEYASTILEVLGSLSLLLRSFFKFRGECEKKATNHTSLH